VLPVPQGVPLEDWLGCFPCFAFLLTCPADRVADCVEGFRGRGLTAEPLGVLDDSGLVRLVEGGREATVFDLTTEGVTHLHG
jgi:selenophosphate synthetase-related protein